MKKQFLEAQSNYLKYRDNNSWNSLFEIIYKLFSNKLVNKEATMILTCQIMAEFKNAKKAIDYDDLILVINNLSEELN